MGVFLQVVRAKWDPAFTGYQLGVRYCVKVWHPLCSLVLLTTPQRRGYCPHFENEATKTQDLVWLWSSFHPAGYGLAGSIGGLGFWWDAAWVLAGSQRGHVREEWVWAPTQLMAEGYTQLSWPGSARGGSSVSSHPPLTGTPGSKFALTTPPSFVCRI